jgi:transposase-like protein
MGEQCERICDGYAGRMRFGCDAECHVTRRYGTERKSIQDPASNSLVPDAPGPVDNPNFDRFIELDDIGWSASRIAEEIGVSYRTVQRWRSASGRLKATPAPRHPMSDRERALAMIRDGAPFREAGKAVGVTEQTLHRWFPEERAWSKSQAGQYGQMSRRLGLIA